MPSRKMLPGDTGYVRMTVLEACSDAFRVSIDDGYTMAVTAWVPARECSRHEDIAEMRPIIRRRGYLER